MVACPYCNNVRSLLLGHVYCSRQAAPMHRLDTGTLFIKTKRLEETADHESRLSIRLSLNGRQYYRVGNNDHLITPDKYLIINQGQHYRTAFDNGTEQEIILVAFQPDFAGAVLHTLVTPPDRLLDDPFGVSGRQPVLFFEKTYDIDPLIRQLFARLRRLMDADISTRQTADLDGIYGALLLRMLETHRGLKPEIDRLGSLKPATRVELYRRLYAARDYLDAHLSRRVSLEEAARAACLSTHHFKREFQRLFGIPPHRYHVDKRLEWCRETLRKPGFQVQDIARQAGFEDASSFARLFRQRFSCSPLEYAGGKN